MQKPIIILIGLIQTVINSDIKNISKVDKINWHKKVNELLFNKDFIIYTSNLNRTIQTSNALFPQNKITNKLAIFNELDCHELDGIKKSFYNRDELNSKVKINKKIIDKKIISIISFLKDEQKNYENIVIFSHGMLIRAIISYLSNIEFDTYDLINSTTIQFNNLSIAEIDINELKVNKIIL